MSELQELTTEQRNPGSMNIDRVDTLEMVTIINQEDKKVAEAVEATLPQIALAIDQAAERFISGGRLIYIGAGTSGRLGTLDAVELTPTYSVPDNRAFGIIAGGKKAMYVAVEGAEDSKELAINDLQDVSLSEKDVVIALAASGRTPYALSAIEYGNKVGALTIAVTCTEGNVMVKAANVGISVVVGPEVITGSTRMKAGTAQKMVLNTLSTGVMIKSGKVYQNLMINVQATNSKLVDRSIRIIAAATELSFDEAAKLFEAADKQVNLAIVMHEKNLNKEDASQFLLKNNGRITK